ncbi:MAG TPA: hypothetical protein ENI23_00640 [bacterium]|nr:hypothetical protein [bacterium]
MAPRFEIDRLQNNVNAKITISGLPRPKGAPATVTGFVQDNITIGGKNDYNKPGAGGAQQKLSQVASSVASVANIFGANMGQFQIMHLSQTVNAWVGSGKPQFQIPMLFLATKESDDVRVSVARIMDATYPTRSSIVTLRAPLGYAVNPRTAAALRGTLAVRVGNYFRATRMLIIEQSFKLSKEPIRSGAPLYAEGSITIEPYRLLTAAEIKAFIFQ